MKRKETVAVVVATFAVAIAIAVSMSGARKKRDAAAPRPAPTKASASAAIDASDGPPVDVTAQQLLTAYLENEVAADARFLGKPLRVAGIVERIEKDSSTTAYVVLRAASRDIRVQANFEELAAVVPLRPGQEVAFRCRGDGKVLAALQLASCTVE